MKSYKKVVNTIKQANNNSMNSMYIWNCKQVQGYVMSGYRLQ